MSKITFPKEIFYVLKDIPTPEDLNIYGSGEKSFWYIDKVELKDDRLRVYLFSGYNFAGLKRVIEERTIVYTKRNTKEILDGLRFNKHISKFKCKPTDILSWVSSNFMIGVNKVE